MVKTAIILVLLILLGGGAFLSRPTKQSFDAYIREQMTRKDAGWLTKLTANWQTDSFLESCKYNDRLLWVDVQHEGKVKFIGAFSRFFSVGGDAPATATQDVKPARKGD